MSTNIKDHGTVVDKGKGRVQCKYCGKSVSGSTRLKFHLGGVRGDVIPCPKVPENVKKLFRDIVFLRNNISKEVDALDPLEKLPPKRRCSQRTNNFKNKRHACENQEYSFSVRREEETSTSDYDEVEEDTLSEEARKIGRFFYQNLIEVTVVSSASFREMISSTMGKSRPEFRIPSSRQLKGKILQAEVTEMQGRVQRIKQSWSSTGCSIILDTWTDKNGQDLVSFLVDCPQGPIYLKTSKISSLIDNHEALQSMVNEVIEEVGADNVVQTLACSTTGWLSGVAEKFMHQCRTVFWTVSASHCIDLILEKIRLMDSVRPVMEKVTSLTNFIVKLVKEEEFALIDIKVPCLDQNSAAAAFVTLEDIVTQQEKMETLITSSEWETSSWASMEEGKQAAELVRDPSFWTGAMTVLKASGPLISVLNLIGAADKPFMGYIYETMDQVKETIKKDIKSKSKYEPFWKIIDEIWDGHLHSPLHAAGYYLNPSLFYSSDFNSDSEVCFGLLCCVVRMIQDQRTQTQISLQLDKYRFSEGAFGEGSSIECRKRPPVEWWSMYGRECPELQRFAIRVLSQTCDGPSRFGLRREMAQRLLEGEANGIDQQEQAQLQDLTFVHYNLQLQYLKKQNMEVRSHCE